MSENSTRRLRPQENLNIPISCANQYFSATATPAFHRYVFPLAGTYNIIWGLYAVYDPQWLFKFAEMPLINQPPIFAALGMVVGLYGVLYLKVARVPERGWLLAAIGLVGKLMGPAGLLPSIWTG